jgi:hypothetical protein
MKKGRLGAGPSTSLDRFVNALRVVAKFAAVIGEDQ